MIDITDSQNTQRKAYINNYVHKFITQPLSRRDEVP